MSQDSSLVGEFDLKSQSGVMLVLAAIRASKLSPAEKNELRDLVFLYSNGGGDATVRNQLEQKLKSNQITPVGMQRAGKPVPTLTFGTYRPTPSFNTTLETTAVATPEPAPVFYKNATPEPTSSPSTPTTFQSTPPSTQSTPLPETSGSAPVAPTIQTPPPYQNQAPVTPPVVTPIPLHQTSVASPTVATVPTEPISPPLPEVQSVPVSPQAGGVGSEAVYLERIRQIKTAVNSKVGNPVNLVDINNEVGREYMNALLEAMKKLSSGAISEMEPAMSRLESAYKAVEVAIVAHKDIGNLPETQTPVSVPPLPQNKPPVTENTVRPLVSVQPPPTPPQPSPHVPPPPRVENRPLQATPVQPTTPTPPVTPANIPVPPLAVESRKPEAPTKPAFVPPPLPKDNDVQEDRSAAWAGTGNEEKVAQTKNDTAQAPSLAEARKILTPSDLPDPATLKTGEQGDPLATKEIDDGLNQLLADWSLFKKSGLFGTGPKGIEHPLFKKIANLQVPLLLAGRFEGASQEIRQSITDYMNGWRYEQGIVYSPGETFEKYLRRVIKHILDLQKKRQTP